MELNYLVDILRQREEILRKRKSDLHSEGLDSLVYDLLKNERRRLFTIFNRFYATDSHPAAVGSS